METQVVEPREGNPADPTTTSLTFLDRVTEKVWRAFPRIMFGTIEGGLIGGAAATGAFAVKRIVETGATYSQDPQLYQIAIAFLTAAAISLPLAKMADENLSRFKRK